MENLAGYALEVNIGGGDALEVSVGEASMLRGEDGKSAYEIAVQNGYTGTEAEWLASLKGDAFTFSDFTAEQLAALKGADGTSPTVATSKTGKVTTITVTDKDGEHTATINDGADGKSAYQYAQEGGYTGNEEAFAEKLAQEPLIGTTNELTPTQVYDAVSAGIPVKVRYFNNTFGILAYTNFSVAESLNLIGANTISYFNSVYILGELIGNTDTNEWSFLSTILAQKSDIPSALPNPNAITFTGAVTGSYDGSAPMSVNVPSAVTDDHINSLIDTKLGVIENGAY